FSLMQSPEDYYQRYMISSAIRWLRYLFFAIALLAPSAYIAILTYHQEMIPSSLLLSIAKSREEIPFPALVEAIIMETMFEALREAGVRLPKQVGAAVSIVGALVIGQAATSAGLVSSPMVMVVAITGIASFMIPHYTVGISIRLLRFPIMLLAGFMGLLGLLMGLIALVIHLCSLRSFGLPYLSPIAPMMVGEWKDVLARSPAWTPLRRPRLTGSGGGRRRGRDGKPLKPVKEKSDRR
ncbi:MAG: spore germination protein, partial [Paenibacillus sp.]|nr:spore germination protein [Paenibacillus sp.]